MPHQNVEVVDGGQPATATVTLNVVQATSEAPRRGDTDNMATFLSSSPLLWCSQPIIPEPLELTQLTDYGEDFDSEDTYSSCPSSCELDSDSDLEDVDATIKSPRSTNTILGPSQWEDLSDGGSDSDMEVDTDSDTDSEMDTESEIHHTRPPAPHKTTFWLFEANQLPFNPSSSPSVAITPFSTSSAARSGETFQCHYKVGSRGFGCGSVREGTGAMVEHILGHVMSEKGTVCPWDGCIEPCKTPRRLRSHFMRKHDMARGELDDHPLYLEALKCMQSLNSIDLLAEALERMLSMTDVVQIGR